MKRQHEHLNRQDRVRNPREMNGGPYGAVHRDGKETRPISQKLAVIFDPVTNEVEDIRQTVSANHSVQRAQNCQDLWRHIEESLKSREFFIAGRRFRFGISLNHFAAVNGLSSSQAAKEYTIAKTEAVERLRIVKNRWFRNEIPELDLNNFFPVNNPKSTSQSK